MRGRKVCPGASLSSGFYRFDANQSYQYRAFGVPGLGFKRGLGDDQVIAPYASLMAICHKPQEVYQNLLDLVELNAQGLYGFYESIDFTPERMLVGEKYAIVKEYMAHHQGMILMALDNYFQNDIMVSRMHRDPRIQSVDLLLQEQVPHNAPLLNPYGEDVKGVQRITTAPVEITPWSVPVQSPIPQVHLLANSTYSVLITNAGSGYSAYRDNDLTRWQPDGVLDPWGTWIYIQDMEMPPEEGLWSAGFQPVPGDPDNSQVTFFAHMLAFRRSSQDITSTMEITVAPEDPIEIRRVTLNNNSSRTRALRLTSYGEVILTKQAADARHPAFNKLFIENEYVPEYNLQIFKRRPRSADEQPIYMGHMLVPQANETQNNGHILPPAAHEGDRYRFIGRDQTSRHPAALYTEDYLSGSSGATLDPIFCLGQTVQLKPHGTTQVAFLSFAGTSREDILTLAQRYNTWTLIERTYHQADIAAQNWLGRNHLNTQMLQEILQVLSALIFPFKAVRAEPEIIAANQLGQPALWRFGISGDFPILLIRIEDSKQLDLVREALQVHRYLRSRRFLMDIVIMNQQQTNYGAELNGLLYRLVSRTGSEQWLNQRGGIFVLYGDQMQPAERTLLYTAARVLLDGARGSLQEQLPGYSIQVQHLPQFIATRESVPVTGPVPDAAPEALDPAALPPGSFYNGHGRFSPDGREYLINVDPNDPTPAPWVNIIGYPHFGFMVSESGSQCTWSINSGENRLTPWFNDPVRDPTGEALYLRDEETGAVWSPTSQPAGEALQNPVPVLARHGAGYSIFERQSHGLSQRLRVFASPEDPVKVIHLHLENTLENPRRITATQYVEWVLGTLRAVSQSYIIPEYDHEHECLLANNPYSPEFSERFAFLAANKPVHGLTADRAEFIGRNGSRAQPAAFRRIGLETRITPGEDPCAVLQLHIDLPPGGAEDIYFLLGEADNRQQALELVEKYHDPAQVAGAWQATQDFWDRLLDAVQVHTPDPAMDHVLNRWLLYQALSCRVWGRTAFYQSSGAFGFRDQLQDVLGTFFADPTIARGQILNAARHQFEAGDVLHWWHPPSGRGVRTRISDDLLWLPYVTALYVEATGDRAILEEEIPFLHAPPLKPDEDERYGEYPQTKETYALLEHCKRAIQHGATSGANGLPLIGTGDWNDGFNRVGEKGQGESIWLAWFLYDVLMHFARIVEQIDDAETAEKYRSQAKAYADSVEKTSWDGDWYRRAYYDDGAPLGSTQDLECHIDAIAQSWSVLSGAGDAQHVQQAMRSVLEKLVEPQNRLSLLFTPPFNNTPRDPGYIKGYLPGTRENGGQYTHAAIWTAWAFARLGEGQQASALFDLLNPIYQSDTPEKAAVYRVEPYVVVADIYSVPPYLRRGGWTWYTGSAAWLYRLGVEGILGLRRVNGEHLFLDPVIPPAWDGYQITYRYGKATYQIQVNNPQHCAHGVQRQTLDGQELKAKEIPLRDDGLEHQVIITLGE